MPTIKAVPENLAHSLDYLGTLFRQQGKPFDFSRGELVECSRIQDRIIVTPQQLKLLGGMTPRRMEELDTVSEFA
jgi:hypothetical protein